VVHGIKSVLPYMLQSGKGHIVNVASMAGKIGSAKGSAYSATKHAVLGLTHCLRQELIGTGVRISAVNPGPVDTPFFDIADPGGQYKKNVGFFMLRPERVADEIVKVLRKGKAESDIPFAAALGVKLYQLFPRLLDKMYAKILNKK
ncbi:MAG TPA: SDR family NAD(P)-dependent oxidoreductase, partial [Bacilli bacterium]